MRAWDGDRPVEVVLEEDGDVAPAGAGGGPRVPGASPGARRRRRALAAGAVLVLVAVLAGADALAERRERAALAAVADVPGLVRSLAEPVRELWRLPTGPLVQGVPDRVVTVRDDALVGLDAATGERRWSVPLTASGAACPLAVPGRDAPGVVVCFGVGEAAAAPGAAVVQAVDAADGTVRADLRSAGQLIDGATVDGDVVLVGSGTGGLTVTRRELVRGEERWSAALGDVGRGPRTGRVHGDRQVVALEAATTVVLDAGDGRELGRWAVAPDDPEVDSARVVSRPGAGFGVWPSRSAGRWFAADGTPGPALDGEPVETEIDDGSAADVVLLRSAAGDRLSAVDVTSGATLWERPAPDRVLVRLAGRLLVGVDGRLEAWDARSAEVAWSTGLGPEEDVATGGPYTDGVRLVLPGEGPDGMTLTAYRVADGDRLWESALPAGTSYVAVLGDRLVAVGRLDGGAVQSAAFLG